MHFDVSVITINYNSEKHTINCIESLLKHTPSTLSCQYIIIDNASEIESYNTLKNYFESLSKSNPITLIRSKINTGFGGGNMLGVQHAEGRYLAFINNDTILQNDCLSILKNYMENNPDCGVCGPHAYTSEGKLLSTIDHFASPVREILGRGFLEKINSKKYPKRKKIYTEPVQAQFIAGSFMFFNAEDFNNCGGFDTNIFLYYEETDICKRLFNNNKKSYLVPSASFIHYHGVSTPKSIDTKIELKLSLLYVIRKHYGFFGHKLVLIFMIIKYFFSGLLKIKNRKLFKILCQGAPLSMSLKQKQKIVKI